MLRRLTILLSLTLAAVPALSAAPEIGTAIGYYGGSRDFGGVTVRNLMAGYIIWDNAFVIDWGKAGNLRLAPEFVVKWQVDPDAAHLVGVTPMWRYTSHKMGPLAVFAEASVGFSLTDLGRPDLSTLVQFMPQCGFGASYAVEKPWLDQVTLRYRFLHVSNADLGEPNSGVNAHGILLGAVWKW